MIFNKARDEKKTGGKPESPGKGDDSQVKSGVNPAKPQPVSCFFCFFFSSHNHTFSSATLQVCVSQMTHALGSQDSMSFSPSNV